MSATKSKSITFSQETGRWEVMVPINWSKIMSPTYELAGSYATEKEALDALDNYYDKTASQMRYGGVMARVEADQQTIVALRLHVAALKKELDELKTHEKYAPGGSGYLAAAARWDRNVQKRKD